MAASKSAAGHIRKRQYQPSITSYLHRDAAAQHIQRPTSSWSPPLPEETQASLLSVGMRVRKSVPEGYKTHNTIKSGAYAFTSSAPAASATPKRLEKSYKTTRAAELQPFCGLHKTGGWGAQDVHAPSSSAPAVMQHEDYEEYEEEVPGLMWSQNTISSTQNGWAAPVSTSKKRGYEEEMEDDLDAFFNDYDFDNAIAVTTTTTLQLRPIARLKSSGRRVPAESEVVHVVGAGGDGFDFDFGDAAFLAPPEGMDTD